MRFQRLRAWASRLFESPGPDVSGFPGFLFRIVRLLWFGAREFHRTLCFERSSSLTFATLLSLIPVSVLFLGFAVEIGQGDRITKYIEENVYPYIAPDQELRDPLQALVTKAKEQLDFGEVGNLVGLVALVSLVIAALGVILAAERNFNRIWQTRSTRSYLQKFTVFWVILTISPFVLLASTQVGELGGTVVKGLGLEWLYSFVLPASLGVLGFTVLYIFLPSSKVSLPSALIGAFVAALLWDGSRRGFTVYVQRSKDLYGQLATVPLFLVWVYLNWVITLYGCVLSYVHQNFSVFDRIGQTRQRVSPVPLSFVGVCLLHQVARAFQGQQAILTAQGVGKQLGISPARVEEAATLLVKGGFIAETVEPADGYALRRPPEAILLRDVLETLPQEDFPHELGTLGPAGRADATVGAPILEAFRAGRRSYLDSFSGRTLADGLKAQPASGVPDPAAPAAPLEDPLGSA